MSEVEQKKLRAQITAKLITGALTSFCNKKGVKVEKTFSTEDVHDVVTEVLDGRVKLSQVEKLFQQ